MTAPAPLTRVEIVVPGDPGSLWTYTDTTTGRTLAVPAPVFHLDGGEVTAAVDVEERSTRRLGNGVAEHRVVGTLRGHPHLRLAFVAQVNDAGPVVRFRYELLGDARLTKPEGRDRLTYLAIPGLPTDRVTEVQLAAFDEMLHSYAVAELDVAQTDLAHGSEAAGPIVVGSGAGAAWLIAYEHGAQLPDSFLTFGLRSDLIEVTARKGNYLADQALPMQTVWFHIALVEGTEDELAKSYRQFLLHHQSEWPESRRPYVFYNTWAWQERTKWWHDGRYLDPMSQEPVLREIEAAAQAGVDVFVLDTGWYQKTGDWEVHTGRFDASLATVRAALEERDMHLGLWFGPLSAALSSDAAVHHPEYRMSWAGIASEPAPVWETEASYRMCLVSGYGDYFADRVIGLARETGATYFKLDAVDQYGCDDPGHDHGDETHSRAERADSYAYQLPLALTRIAERICREVPSAIVDYDVTEAQRSMGLAFLAAGKFFLINNGPYYRNMDIPSGASPNENMFFFPGTARSRLCRAVLGYDKWIPSSLLLTHYLPDAPRLSQTTSIASAVLGQGGFWGEFASLEEGDRAHFRDMLDKYKEVREDITEADPVRYGRVGAAPEVHEKLSESGRGVVAVFSPFAVRHIYRTEARPARDIWHTDNVSVVFQDDDRAVIEITFDEEDAALIFFS
ncbi:alpha-galactosidase [Curtobacterium sp. MCBD17_040]|uniref:alpha-galactosidase n=1 Tax=Curtobacterium sp. MCBD17_040 TaxID=2175674 RepID=UPI000DAA86F4|nr:alpha-galactosidase [Curtobacterium sp. MCBD17_040]WIB65265.1 alpha-galactosidase [Curtobacterium sp. MCBD17_040]